MREKERNKLESWKGKAIEGNEIYVLVGVNGLDGNIEHYEYSKPWYIDKYWCEKAARERQSYKPSHIWVCITGEAAGHMKIPSDVSFK